MPESPIAAVETDSDLVVIRILTDRLDEDHLRALQSEVRAAAAAHPSLPCILDLASVSFVPSLTLAGLIRLHSEFQARRQRLILAALQPQVRNVIVITRLDRLFELHEDVASATRSVRPA
jgi:anti-sigma B factor antagonist